MMRMWIGAGAWLALLIASCGPKALALPEDPVERAATCGVVAAAGARLATADVKAPLSLEAQTKIVHFALLAASQGGTFEGDTANAVSKRMSEIQERVTGGKWQALQPACEAAYPEAERSQVTLPARRIDAQLACEELAEFLGTALVAQDINYGNELAEIRRMRSELNDALAPGLRALAGSGHEAQQRARRKALAASAKLGNPIAVVRQCQKKFG